MFLPMVESPPGTLWEDPMAGIALCHSIACGVGGILTEEVLGIRLGFPLKITPHNGGSLQSCHGFITTPKRTSPGGLGIAEGSLPVAGVAAPRRRRGGVSPAEAKAVWQSAPATDPWRDVFTISGGATIVVTPGKVELR